LFSLSIEKGDIFTANKYMAKRIYKRTRTAGRPSGKYPTHGVGFNKTETVELTSQFEKVT
jgi:hypothetical protein